MSASTSSSGASVVPSASSSTLAVISPSVVMEVEIWVFSRVFPVDAAVGLVGAGFPLTAVGRMALDVLDASGVRGFLDVEFLVPV